IEDVELDAQPAKAAGESSIAVFVKGSSNVVFRRVTMKAGDAKAGDDGVSKTNWSAVEPTDSTIAGHDAIGAEGGTSQTCANVCANSKASTGGAGGAGSPTAPVAGSAGGPALGAGPPDDGAGGFGACLTGGAGHNGAIAPAGKGGAPAAESETLDANGWH